MDLTASTSAKLYFLVFVIGCATAFNSNRDASSSSNGTGIAIGSGSVSAAVDAVSDGGPSNVVLSAGSFNTAGGYMVDDLNSEYASGGVNGGANIWGTAAGNNVTATGDAQSFSAGAASYTSSQTDADKKADGRDVDISAQGEAGSSAEAALTAYANSAQDSSTLELNANVGTGDNSWIANPDPSVNNAAYANSVGSITGSGDDLGGNMYLADVVNPYVQDSSITETK